MSTNIKVKYLLTKNLTYKNNWLGFTNFNLHIKYKDKVLLQLYQKLTFVYKNVNKLKISLYLAISDTLIYSGYLTYTEVRSYFLNVKKFHLLQQE